MVVTALLEPTMFRTDDYSLLSPFGEHRIIGVFIAVDFSSFYDKLVEAH